jgi:hypothetical protein
MGGQLTFKAWIRMLSGLLVGAFIGSTVYWADRLKEPGLIILVGAVGGGLVAGVSQFYSNTVRLTDIKVTVPQFSEMHFAVTKDSQQVAWKLFVESVTRISTQPLSTDYGLLREALTSLYGLFSITRETLKIAQPSTRTGRDPTVEHLAIAMLNNELRPFLSRWHPALLEWERAHTDQPESAWPQGAECRTELISLQRRLEPYVLGFGRLARLPNAKEILEGTLGFSATEQSSPKTTPEPQPPPTLPSSSTTGAYDA